MNKTTYYLTMALEALEEMAGNLGMTSEPAVITDIKEALAQPQPEPVANLNECNSQVYEHGISVGYFDMPKGEAEKYCKKLTEETGLKHDWHYVGGRVHVKALATPPQPEQEPVAWRTFDGEGGYDYRSYEDNESYADDWNKRNPNHKGWVDKLYTHSQRTWVGLTDDEIDAIYTGVRAVHREIDSDVFTRAIEAKLKEKNT